MRNRVRRAGRLFELQHELLQAELAKLKELQNALTQAQQAETGTLDYLFAEWPPALPPQFIGRMAAAAISKVRAHEAALQSQMNKTLEQARKEAAAKRRFEGERAKQSN